MKIVCTGSVAYDYLMRFPGYFKNNILPAQLDNLSLSFLVDEMVKRRGGIAPNICYTLALLGTKPILFATVGEDFLEYRQWLDSQGIDTRFARVIQGKFTASFFVNTDMSNAQIASFYSGAMGDAAQLSINELAMENPDLVVISPNAPDAMAKYVQECKLYKVKYLYDPSQQLARINASDIQDGVNGAHSLFVNDYEFELLQKHTGMSSQQLLDKIELVVVTRGEDGASVYAEGKEHRVPIVPPATIADPTGVGDAFRGGFLSGMHHNLDWKTCGQMGSLAATYCLENVGTQSHSYTPAQFINRYREHFDDQNALDVLLLNKKTQ